MLSQQIEIIKAIEEEIHSSSKPRHFKVFSASRQTNTIRIRISSQASDGPFDNTLEGGAASWKQWASTVVSVSTEESSIYIHLINCLLPEPGTEITINPPKFLESLLQCWKNEDIATKCFSWATHALVERDRRPIDVSPSFSDLRQRQREAYSLLSYSAGFLWGPPGTGKTTTAAAIVADLLCSDANARILLIAPTNIAVDQLLTNVDDRLSSSPKGQLLRRYCARVGSNFAARLYEGRRHLLPEATDEVVIRKAQLEVFQPDPDKPEARAQWEKEMSGILAALRSQVQLVLKERRVVAMTATLATMHFGLLREESKFDLAVFDEASQLGRVVSLMLAPLAHRVLIAGDPRQLSPIFKSNHASVKRWFGQTLFDNFMHESHASTCFLNEQSRMSEEICTLVSKVFYSGQLEVSKGSLTDGKWRDARQPMPLFASSPHNLHLVEVNTESERYVSSHRRIESAQMAVSIAQKLGIHVDHSKIMILTPFIAQRKLIRKELDARGIRRIRVSTVHAAQGAEFHTIIFDPVKGMSPFLLDFGKGSRLLNVAISRAQACFVLLASKGDLNNSLLAAIAAHIRNASNLFV